MAPVPLYYELFFLYIEPIITFVGAYFSWFEPNYYLTLTHALSAPNGLTGVPLGTGIALRQLGNMYFAFVLNEALVLRATDDLKVWRTLLFGLLVADFGHLYTCLPLGLQHYCDIQHWNPIDFGNILFVYCGAISRICFLAGIGMKKAKSAKDKSHKKVKMAAPVNENRVYAPPNSPAPVASPPSPRSTKKRGKKNS